MQGFSDRLTQLPTHILAHITGERRRRLAEYLLRWGEPEAALRALDCWLAAQPHLATLREARARVLVEDGRAAQALALLDELDAERGMTEGRRALRMRALAALGRWDAAYALLPSRPDDPATWHLRAELLRRQGRLGEAADAYVRAAELMPEGSAPMRGLAEIALAQGDAARARALLLQRRDRFRDAPLATRDLVLLRQAAELLGDAEALAELDTLLHERREAERAALCAEIGLDAAEEDKGTSGQGDKETASDDALPISVSPCLPAPEAEEAALPDDAWAALREHFGYQSFRPGQAEVVARVLRGESVLAVLPTGAGKSLTYQLPALLLPGATLVLSPLIALMKDQLDNLPPRLADRATTIHSALDGGAVAARLRGVADGRYKLIYVAPERLRQQPFVHALSRAGVARVVVDEAHCVSLWGVSFRPDYLFIRRALVALGSPPVLALTATATPETEAEIKAHLAPLHEEHHHDGRVDASEADASRTWRGFADRDMKTVRTSIFRPNLRFEVRHVANKHDKIATVVDLCRAIEGPIVVYARARDACEELAARLRDHGVAAEHYHALVTDRHAVQDRFMHGATRVLAATVAFGMGVDKADVRAIVHYNLPPSVEAYYQEAGRAGRDGLPARCVLLYAPSDKGNLTVWLREEMPSKDYLRDVYRWLRGRLQLPGGSEQSGGWGVVALDDLRRDLREQDETRMRVALGLLERVGLVARHFDLPRAVTLLLRDSPAVGGISMLYPDLVDEDGRAALRALVDAARLRPGQALDVDLLALAARLDCSPVELEGRLLGWHDQGWLRYEGTARDVLLQLCPATADVASRIDALLAEYADRQSTRVSAITAYARSVACRHRAIAAHFGERLARCGGVCDSCAPAGDQRPTTNDQRRRTIPSTQHAPRNTRPATGDIDETILSCLAHLPFPVGRSGLAKVLKGSAGSAVGPERCPEYAALGAMTLAAIEAQIDRLVEGGYLARRVKGHMPLLALTDRGAGMIPDRVVQ